MSELVDDIRDAIIDYQVGRILKQFLWTSDLQDSGLDSTPTGHI